MDWFTQLNPVIQALVATIFTWLMTALGASLVFAFKSFNRKLLDAMLGFAAGVMIAASFWSLLAPAIDMAEAAGKVTWIVAATGFLFGGVFLFGVDKVLPHLHPGFTQPEGLHSSLQRSVLLVLAITLHNIPEGLAVGVAFGAVASSGGSTTVAAAIALAIGIGLQNFPEGTAVAVPLRREGMKRGKAFWYGQLSGFVEPISGVLGAWAVLTFTQILPFALAFAAGAMIFVVTESLIPESQTGGHTDIATIGTMVGFAVMMVMDVALA